MKKIIDMMAQVLEKNTIPLPNGEKKKDGGSNYENKKRCHALVVGSSGSSSFIIDSGASRHMDSVKKLLLLATSIQCSIHPHG